MDNDDDNPLRVLQVTQFKERMESLRTGFAELEKADVRTIPENIFKANFLEFFCGETKDTDNRLLKTWFVIAGTNYSPVNIVDAAGNFIIQVPPVHDKNIISPILERKEDLAYAFGVAHQKASLSPNLATNMINNELGDRYGKLINNNNSQLTDQWLLLFKHYGKLRSNDIVKTNGLDDTDEFEW